MNTRVYVLIPIQRSFIAFREMCSEFSSVIRRNYDYYTGKYE